MQKHSHFRDNLQRLTREQVAGKKQRDNAAADAEMKAKRLAQAEAEGSAPEAAGDEPSDMLAAEDDDDVIF